MKPYFERDGITIYHGDCREILPGLTIEAGAIITDPSFEEEAHTLQRRINRSPTRGADEDILTSEPLPFDPIDEATRNAVCVQASRLLRGWFIAFCQAEAVAVWRDSVTAAGGSYKRACVWIKPDGMPQYSGDRPGMGYESIVAAWFGGGRSEWNGGGRHGVFTHTKNEPVRWGHPTQKPQRLMFDLVALFSDPTDLILDPFAGSGSTLRACKDMGRRAIGIEKIEAYCEIAARRLDQGVLELGA